MNIKIGYRHLFFFDTPEDESIPLDRLARIVVQVY
jgi:hypothetical protein